MLTWGPRLKDKNKDNDRTVKNGTVHSWMKRAGDTDMLEREKVGQIASRRNANFPVLSVLMFIGPGAVLAECCSLAPHQSDSPSAEEEIHSHRDITDRAFRSSNCAGAEGRLFFKDNNFMTVLRHSNLVVPN